MKILFLILISIFTISFLYNLYQYGVALRKEEAADTRNRFLERRVNRPLLISAIDLAVICMILQLWILFL